jgi:DNA polymerase
MMIERSINPNAKILIVGDCPSRSDMLAARPFASGDGQELNKMLHEAGIIRTDCHLTYVMPKPVPGREPARFFEKYTRAYQVPSVALQEGIDNLFHLIVDLNPNLIIALGELPLWALTGEMGITKWRGSILTTSATECFEVKLIPTYAPDVVQRKWDWRYIAVQDFRRAAQESHSPHVTIPNYHFIIRPSFTDVMMRLNYILAMAADAEVILAGDIETRRGHIACMGIGWSDTEAICIPFICVENLEGYWTEEEEIAINLRLPILRRTMGLHPPHLHGYDARTPYMFCGTSQGTRFSVLYLL